MTRKSVVLCALGLLLVLPQHARAGISYYDPTNHKDIDVTTSKPLPVTSSGTATATGPVADNATASGNPLIISGVDNTGKAQWVSVDSTGRFVLGSSETMADGLGNYATMLTTPFGAQVASAPLATYPFVWDATAASWQRLPGTTSGVKAIASGAAANGAAVSGSPVLMGGSDGTNARSIATDTSGNQKVVLQPVVPADYTATQMGFNALAISNGVTTVGTFVNVKGYKRFGIAVSATKNFTLYYNAVIGSLTGSSTAGARNAGSVQTFNGTAGLVYTNIIDVGCDTLAVVIQNTDATSGTFTVTGTALP
jgi:hypothetical protein